MPRDVFLDMYTLGVSLRVFQCGDSIGGGVLFLCMPAIGVNLHQGALPWGVFNVVFSSGGGGYSISSTYCTPEDGWGYSSGSLH